MTLRIPIHVVDEQGAGVAGARVLLLDPAYRPLTGGFDDYLTTGPDGRAAFEALPARPSHGLVVVAYAAGREAATTGDVPLEQARSGLQLVMGRGVAVEGQLLDEGGAPLEKALTLWLRAEEEGGWPYFYKAEADISGRFRVAGLRPGRYRVLSDPGGGAPALVFRYSEAWPLFDESSYGRAGRPMRQEPFLALDTPLSVQDGGHHALRLSFSARAIAGVVVDEAGAVVPGATVTLTGRDDDPQQSLTAAADGSFRAELRPAEHIYLRASHPDFGKNRDYRYDGDSYHGPIPSGELRLVLRRGFDIKGQLFDPEGRPLAATEILLVPEYIGSGPWPEQVSTDEAGRFSFGRIWVERFSFALELRALFPSLDFVGSFRQIIPESTWLDDLKAGRALTLKTRDLTYEPVTGALYDASDRPLARTSFQIEVYQVIGGVPSFHLSTSAETGPAGELRLGLQRGETYQLRFQTKDGRKGSWEGDVPPGGLSALRVMLR
jgi:hypothetical protein